MLASYAEALQQAERGAWNPNPNPDPDPNPDADPDPNLNSTPIPNPDPDPDANPDLKQAEKGAWAAAASALKPALDAAPADGPSIALLAQCDAAERQQLSLVAAAAGRRLVLPPPFF